MDMKQYCMLLKKEALGCMEHEMRKGVGEKDIAYLDHVLGVIGKMDALKPETWVEEVKQHEMAERDQAGKQSYFG